MQSSQYSVWYFTVMHGFTIDIAWYCPLLPKVSPTFTVDVWESTITAALELSPATLRSVTRCPPISALGPTDVPDWVGVGDGAGVVGAALGIGLGDGVGDGGGLIPTKGSLPVNGGGIFEAG